MTSSEPGTARSQKDAVGGVFDRAAGEYDTGPIDFFGPAGRDLVAWLRATSRRGW